VCKEQRSSRTTKSNQNQKHKKSELISRVKSLKKVNFEDRDNNAIFRAESALSDFVERELKFELENYKKFELLNAERITPHFMSVPLVSLCSTCQREKV
jgi:hypothetical protein